MTRWPSTLIFGLAFGLAAVALSGCVTTTGGAEGDGQVVERSKPEPPPWTGLAAGRLHDSSGILSYVELRTQLRDLPLGLKTTQLGAVDASRNALAAFLRSKLADDIERVPAAGQPELERKLVDATAEIHGKHAKVIDIYFEKLVSDRSDLPEYYNAFVLVTLPRDRYPELVESLARRLASSQDPSLKSLGQALQAQVKAGGLSH